jgi:hypothetical protein
VIDGLATGPLELDAGSLIAPALRRAGLSNDELELVLLIAEQELAARGALNWVNPVTNVLELSPRSKEVLHIVARSLRAASVVTPKEKSESEFMNADFSVRR